MICPRSLPFLFAPSFAPSPPSLISPRANTVLPSASHTHTRQTTNHRAPQASCARLRLVCTAHVQGPLGCVAHPYINPLRPPRSLALTPHHQYLQKSTSKRTMGKPMCFWLFVSNAMISDGCFVSLAFFRNISKYSRRRYMFWFSKSLSLKLPRHIQHVVFLALWFKKSCGALDVLFFLASLSQTSWQRMNILFLWPSKYLKNLWGFVSNRKEVEACSVLHFRSSNTGKSSIFRGFESLALCHKIQALENMFCSLPAQLKYQRIVDPSRVQKIPPPKECFDSASFDFTSLLFQKSRADMDMSCSSASAAQIHDERNDVFLACLRRSYLRIKRIFI